MKKLIAFALAFAPVAVFAQQITDANQLTTKITNIGNTIVVLLISFSVIWIIVNVVRYLIAGGEEDRKKGGMAILWGVVGLFVILSIWGLVAILTNTFSTNTNIPREKFPVVIPPPQI
jgi:uncharacterized membrane protein YidH (DUF202 family)